MLQAKQDFKELSKNWSEKFFSNHPLLQSEYKRTIDQEQVLTPNRDSVPKWFDLYLSIETQHDILNKDTYNIDENGYIMGIAESFKVVFSKY